MIWKTTFDKITGLTFTKSITLAFLAIFLFSANNAHAQFIPDGDYSVSEYGGGQVRGINDMPSETCKVDQVYSIVKSNSDETYLLLGFYNGNGGQATFRYYLDTDPELNLGSETYKNKTYDFTGADVVLQVTAGGSSADVFKYNGSSLQPFNNSGILAADGDFESGDGQFIEIKVPLSGAGSIIDICDLAEDFTISLGSYISFAGNSTSAKVCDFVNIDLDIAVNGSIDGSTSYCTVTNSTVLTLSGDFSSIKRWEKQEVGSGWVSISNTSNTYTATNVSVTTNYRAIIINNTCPGNEVETGIATITINEAPTAEAGNTAELTCSVQTLQLNGSGTGQGTLSYAWTSSNGGVIDSGANTAAPTVSAAGTYTLTVTDDDNGCSATDTVMITQDNTAPIAEAGNTAELTCSVQTLQLNGSGTGQGNLSYAWTASNGGVIDSGANTATPTVSAAGTYSLTLTDADNGCTSTDTVIITQDISKPTAEAGNTAELTCSVQTLQLNGSGTGQGDLSYAWTASNGGVIDSRANTSTPTVSAAGTYTLTVTDADNGCSANDTIIITQDVSKPTAEAGNTAELTCLVQTLQLNGSGTGQGDLSYAWTASNGGVIDSGANTATPTVSTAGTFTLTVTDADNGCSANDTVIITQDIIAPTAEAGDDMELTCATTSVTLNGSGDSANADANLSYAWTGPGEFTSDVATPSVTLEGIYTLTVTDNDNGCFATDTVEVTKDANVPTASIDGNDELNCNNTEITLDASGSVVNGTASYSWTMNTADGTEVGTDVTLEVTAAGVYFLTVTDLDNGCNATNSVEVTQDNTAPTAEAGDNMELTCTTTSVTLNGSGNSSNEDADLSYAWTGPEGFTSSEAMPGVSVVGTYILTVTDNDNGCFVTDSVEVTQDNTAPTAEAGENMELTCTITSVTLNGSGDSTNDNANLSYAWTGPGEFSSDVAIPSVTVEGTYTLTVTDNDNGCFATDTVEVTKDANVPTASIEGNEELNCNNTAITLDASGSVVNGTASYSWTMNTADGTEVGTEASLEVTAAGVYFLTVTDLDNGCTATNSVEVTQDNTAPTAKAGEDMELTCTTTSITLNGSGDSANADADLSYAWSGPEEFTSDEAMPSVSVVGTYTLTVTDNDNGCFVTDSVEVTQDTTAPTAEAGATMELTCTTTSVTLNGSGNSTNDDANFSYAWSGPGEFTSNEAMPSVTVEGTYTLTVTDNDNGCFATDSVEITKDNNVPTASIEGSEELNCNNTAITLDASGSVVNGTASYSWTIDSAEGTEVGTEATLEVTTAGVYFLTVTDLDNGCTATNSVEVTQDNTAPTAEAGDNMELTCTTTSITLNGSGDSTNDNANLSYAWTGPGEFSSDVATPSVTVEGTYTLTVTDLDNGCFATDIVEVTKDANVPTASIDGNEELNCNNTAITLDASGSVVNGTVSYSWTMNTADGTEVGTEATLEVTAAGVYFLTVTDLDNGCFATNSVEVTQDITAPTAEAGDDMELTCTTTSVTLNGSGNSSNEDAKLSYAWTGPGEFTSDEAMPSVSVIGTYILTVTDNDNGCFVTDSVEVTQDINAPTAEAGENMELTCTTTSVTLNGSGNSTNADANLSYAWSGPGEFTSDVATPSVTVEGTYTLTVTDLDNGCFATDIVEVTKDANVPTASIEGNEELNCNNTAITLDASGSVINGTASYSWTMNTADGTEVGTEATLEVTAAGVYFLTVTDLDNGCFATNSVEVTQDNTAPTAEAGDNMELTCTTTSVTLNGSGDSANTDADLSYAWTGPGGFTSSEAMPGVSVVGTYTLTVTDNDNGCFVTDSVEVTQDINAPTAEAGETMQLTCTTTSVTLNGSGDSTNNNANLSYAWTGPGEFTSDVANPSVTVEGTYTLTVTDLDNGCFATDIVEVTKDANVPTASIEGNEELNCNNTEITLDASGSVVNGTASYSWTMNIADGTEVGTEATLEVTAAGVYFLTVTDLDNGCFATNSVEVTQDNTAPTAEAGDNMELTCTTTSVTLNGSGNSSNEDAKLSYAWTGPGEFTSDEAMPSVSVVGTYTLTVTDNDNGCFVTDSVEVTQDITAPTAEAGENMELTCATTSVTLNGSGNSTNDDADLSYAWTGPGEFSSDVANPSVTVEGTYTLTVTDNDNGCFATDSVEVTKDANVPTASIEGNEELNCNNPAITLDASGSVVNGTASYSWTMDTADGTEVGTQATLEVTAAGVYFLTVTDLDNGCTATNSVEVIFTPDTESPVIIECAAEVNISADAGVCGASDVELGMPNATDNCDSELSIVNDAPEVFPLGQTIVTWTITDTSNNSVQCEQIVNVTDDEAPVVETIADINIESDSDICGAVIEFENIIATDNCEIDSIEVTQGLVSGSVYPIGNTTVIITVTDVSGNSSTTSFDVTVTDTQAPEIICPTDMTVDTETGVSYATVEFEDATATDNCNVTVEQTGGPVSGSQFEIGTTTVTFTATDESGNSTECSFTVTVEDNKDPTITCPANIDLTNDAGVCGAAVEFSIPKFSDNSGFATIEQTGGLESGDVFPVGTTTVSYTVTDEAGNSASCSFDVTVTDTEAPVLTEMDDITMNNDNGVCGAIVNFNTVEATDNCEIDSVMITEGFEPGSEFPVGTTTVTYTVTDVNGNVSTESFTVTVNDNEAPEISCPASMTVDTETGVSYATVDFDNATATDNCEVTVEQTGGPVSGSQFEIGTTTVTFTATDAAGNSSECSFTITVEDNEDPTISCPSDISQNVDAGVCGAAVTFETPSGMDNSGEVTVEQTAGLESGDVFPVGTTTITFTATDAAGNTVSCSFTVTVADDEAPVIEDMENITLNTEDGICGAVADFNTPGATDNCEVESVLLTEGIEPASVFPVGTTKVTYTATDNNGNTATSSFTVTVNDNEAPTIECPESITVNVENGVTGVVVNYNAVTTTDNCEGTTVELTSGIASGEEFPVGQTTVTYTVTDASGNSTTCSFTVTVNENNPAPPAGPNVEVTPATCSNPTGTITVVDAQDGLSYSIDGENYQTEGVFADLAPGTYDVVAQDEFGQLSELTTVVIEDPVAQEIETVSIDPICDDQGDFDLFDLLTGDYDETGNWIDTNNSGALNANILDPSVPAPGSYTFEYIIEGNCPSITTVSLTIDDCVVLDCSIEDIKDGISKAVTPNGDNKNDVFKVDLDLACGFTYNVKIFNRWGAKVFDAQNYQNNWDGYSDSSFSSSNQLPSGTYFYILEIREGNFEPIQGYIYLGTK